MGSQTRTTKWAESKKPFWGGITLALAAFFDLGLLSNDPSNPAPIALLSAIPVALGAIYAFKRHQDVAATSGCWALALPPLCVTGALCGLWDVGVLMVVLGFVFGFVSFFFFLTEPTKETTSPQDLGDPRSKGGLLYSRERTSRIDREGFILTTIVLIMFEIILLSITQTLQVVFSVTCLLFIVIQLRQVVRRLHDIEKTGWLAGLLIVPVVNLYVIYLLIFRRGTAGPNRYGVEYSYQPVGSYQ